MATVTAKLANRFHREFGEEMASEFIEWLNSTDLEARERLEQMYGELSSRNTNEIRLLSVAAQLEVSRFSSQLMWQVLAPLWSGAIAWILQMIFK